jgi:hypothetical protein
MVRGAAFATNEAASRRNFYGKPNLSLFLRFFNAIVFFAQFQSARGSKHIRTLRAPGSGLSGTDVRGDVREDIRTSATTPAADKTLGGGYPPDSG